jgi:protein-tyrosine-phosphatase
MYSLGLSNTKGIKSLASARSFVFVCFGNLMRSPMCEALMKQELAGQKGQVTVISAGLHASPGTRAHPWALAAARELGISLDDHRAQQLTAEMVNQADAIFAMDYRNQVELLAQYPEAKERIFMLRVYERAADRRAEILDPYYGDLDETRECYRLLQKCIHNVASDVLQSLSSG